MESKIRSSRKKKQRGHYITPDVHIEHRQVPLALMCAHFQGGSVLGVSGTCTDIRIKNSLSSRRFCFFHSAVPSTPFCHTTDVGLFFNLF